MLPAGGSYVFFQIIGAEVLFEVMPDRLIVQTVYGFGVPLSDRTPGAMFGVVPNSISPGSTYCSVGFWVVVVPSGTCEFPGPIMSPIVTFHEYAVLELTDLPTGLNCR